MRPATGKVSIIGNPVFSSVVDNRSVRLLDFQHCEVKSHPSDLGKQQVAEVLYAKFHLTEFKVQKRADDLMPTAPDSTSSFDRLRQDHAVNDVDHSV